ncbi:MAG: oligosaccharide flippase family protein, partial [Aliifodinibius sp.]|nr:oligosaccharide flippase family protein [Fodinibius sp.]
YAIRVIIARYYGPEGYGFVSTSLALFTLAYTISLLGFSSSLTRQISYYYTTEKTGRIKSLIFSAYGISSVLSATIGVLLFLSS